MTGQMRSTRHLPLCLPLQRRAPARPLCPLPALPTPAVSSSAPQMLQVTPDNSIDFGAKELEEYNVVLNVVLRVRGLSHLRLCGRLSRVVTGPLLLPGLCGRAWHLSVRSLPWRRSLVGGGSQLPCPQ